jgi:hypothetical protein
MCQESPSEQSSGRAAWVTMRQESRDPENRTFPQPSDLATSSQGPESPTLPAAPAGVRHPVRTDVRHLRRLLLLYFPAVLAGRLFELCF